LFLLIIFILFKCYSKVFRDQVIPSEVKREVQPKVSSENESKDEIPCDLESAVTILHTNCFRRELEGHESPAFHQLFSLPPSPCPTISAIKDLKIPAPSAIRIG
jgi:hypothetical protein